MSVKRQTELYLADAGAALANELYETGLLQQVNSVLHPHGLALGVSIAPSVEGGQVDGLSLHETSDPGGMFYDEQGTRGVRAKLREAGLIRTRRVLTAGAGE